MNKKLFLAIVLVFCMMLTLCACGGEGAATKSGEPDTAPSADTTPSGTEGDTTPSEDTAPTAPTAPTPADGQVLYTIKVVDKDGNPVPSAYVQICKDTCLPGITNEEGIAYFCMVEDEYKVAFTLQPEIYYYFESGSREMTLVYEEPTTNDVG